MAGVVEQLGHEFSGLLPPTDDVTAYCTDCSGLPGRGAPCVVVRPKSTEDVVRIVSACRDAGLHMTISGGRTGKSGGAVPDDGDVVVSLELMNGTAEFDEQAGTIVVGAGAILENVSNLVESRDWYFPLDIGARGSCQFGGLIATNAGGNRVLRYGTMRDLTLGVEVVLPNGVVLNMMNHSLKNNTGIDLKHLFIGSEGVLGIITKAVIRLFPRPARRRTALLALLDVGNVIKLLRHAKAAVSGLSSFEVMWSNYLRATTLALRRTSPFQLNYPIYVLLEQETAAECESRSYDAFLEDMLQRNVITDAVIASSSAQATQLWGVRDAIDEVLRPMSPYINFDVTIPLVALEEFVTRIDRGFARDWPRAKKLYFGHLGDGNMHISTGPHEDAEVASVESFVYSEVARVHGGVSGEHGIGRIKKSYLHFSRSDAEVALMRGIRTLVDEHGLMNSGRVFD